MLILNDKWRLALMVANLMSKSKEIQAEKKRGFVPGNTVSLMPDILVKRSKCNMSIHLNKLTRPWEIKAEKTVQTQMMMMMQ